MIGGKIGFYPQGDNFDNELTQIYLELDGKQLLFNDYISAVEKKELITELAPILSNLTVVTKKAWERRKVAKKVYDNWAKQKQLPVFHNFVLFITTLKLELI